MMDFTLIWEYLNSFPNVTLAHVRFLQPIDQFAQINWPLKAYHRREVWTEEWWVGEGWVCEGIRDFWRHAPSPGCGAPLSPSVGNQPLLFFPSVSSVLIETIWNVYPSPSALILILCCFNAPYRCGWELGGNRELWLKHFLKTSLCSSLRWNAEQLETLPSATLLISLVLLTHLKQHDYQLLPRRIKGVDSQKSLAWGHLTRTLTSMWLEPQWWRSGSVASKWPQIFIEKRDDHMCLSIFPL